jgi:hypothetical protein
MAILKRIVIIVVILLLVVPIGYFSFVKFREFQTARVVRDNKILIDQEYHEWILDPDALLKINVYIRNTSQYLVTGKLIFFVTLEGKGLEESFIDKVIEYVGDKSLLNEVRKSGRGKAIQSYIIRGKKLAQGIKYETIAEKEREPDYTFNFRYPVSLKPGELVQITHEQQIPPVKSGYLVKINIKGIEFE